jgi:hypothetical protein
VHCRYMLLDNSINTFFHLFLLCCCDFSSIPCSYHFFRWSLSQHALITW